MFDFFKNRRTPGFLRSGEDLLEVKEGVLVDAKGRPIASVERVSAFARKLRGVCERGGKPLMLAAAFAIPVTLVAGLAALTLVGGFAAFFFVLMLVETAFGIGVRPNQKRS